MGFKTIFSSRSAFIFAAIVAASLAVFGFVAHRKSAEIAPPLPHVVDSINFVVARSQFNAYSSRFVEVSKVSADLADRMRDSVNIYYRRADSLKTVFEQSR